MGLIPAGRRSGEQWRHVTHLEKVLIQEATQKFSYPQLFSSALVGENPLSNAPVLSGNALQEVVVNVEADAEREKGEVLPHHALHVLLDSAELDLTCQQTTETLYPAFFCL